ncbi:DUF3089 domain-containing protein [Pseudomonadota bacterium]|jgi:hypothetical protein|nr:DUF3089 domain-containing protein [Pseudomonadota bacterium]
MKKFLLITALLISSIGIWVYPYIDDLIDQGLTMDLAYDYFFSGPDHVFDPSRAVAQLDYSKNSSWAALPLMKDEADMIPKGESGIDQNNSPVDVFFVHPTGYLKGDYWTDPLEEKSATMENTQWMMANQASAYNGCCSVYAPHYRQASIYSYFGSDELRAEVHNFVYQDVKKSFEYFIENFSNGRPFIIASHSQGTHHSIRLLAEEIDSSDLYPRMVGAYIIGGMISKDWMSSMENIGVCESAEQIGCLVHWDTMNVAQINKDMPLYSNNICVNPISWKNEGSLSELQDAKGAVPVSGEFVLEFSGDDGPTDQIFTPLEAPLKKYVQAQCKDGALFASDQTGTRFQTFSGSGGNYHGLDYALFYMDIRENAKLKVLTHLNSLERQQK